MQNMIEHMLQARNLYLSQTPKPIDPQQMKQIAQYKLKDQYEGALKLVMKEKQKSTNQQKEGKKESLVDEIVGEMVKQKESGHKVKTFQSYEQNVNESQESMAISKKLEMNISDSTHLGRVKSASLRKLIRPTWHPPFKLYRVIVGHQGWVRSIAISPCNSFFATGSADRTIKFWDLASGELKISLTGHINTVRGLDFSHHHPYLFSCGEDKAVKCWDLQMNKTIRNYHGHLSGVYCLKIHHGLGILVTGGRDSTVRVWDIRVRRQIHSLVGHGHTVASLITQESKPHVVSGSFDSYVKLWDIGEGRCVNTLTNHKKSIRTMVEHPKQYTFATAASDNIKVWKCPNGEFLRNISGHNSIIDSMAINPDGVLVTGGDDGTMRMWDWASGYNFQQHVSQPQPGSIAAENGIFALAFDRSGTRLLSGECDKTIKMWKEDENATQQTHPIKSFQMEFK